MSGDYLERLEAMLKPTTNALILSADGVADLRAALAELKRGRAARLASDATERERLREHVELNLWRANRRPEEIAWMAELAEGAVERIAAQADAAPQQPERGAVTPVKRRSQRPAEDPPPPITHPAVVIAEAQQAFEAAAPGVGVCDKCGQPAKKRHRRRDDLRAIRDLLSATERMLCHWADSDQGGKNDLWRDLHRRADDLSDRYDNRIGRLNRRGFRQWKRSERRWERRERKAEAR